MLVEKDEITGLVTVTMSEKQANDISVFFDMIDLGEVADLMDRPTKALILQLEPTLIDLHKVLRVL